MHWIYFIHKFHNLSWITEINELFHDINLLRCTCVYKYNNTLYRRIFIFDSTVPNISMLYVATFGLFWDWYIRRDYKWAVVPNTRIMVKKCLENVVVYAVKHNQSVNEQYRIRQYHHLNVFSSSTLGEYVGRSTSGVNMLLLCHIKCSFLFEWITA